MKHSWLQGLCKPLPFSKFLEWLFLYLFCCSYLYILMIMLVSKHKIQTLAEWLIIATKHILQSNQLANYNLLKISHYKLQLNELLIGHTTITCFWENVIHVLISDVLLLHMDIYILCFILRNKTFEKKYKLQVTYVSLDVHKYQMSDNWDICTLQPSGSVSVKSLPHHGWKISNRQVAASPCGWTLHSWRSRLTWRWPLWRVHPLDEKEDRENSFVSGIDKKERCLKMNLSATIIQNCVGLESLVFFTCGSFWLSDNLLQSLELPTTTITCVLSQTVIPGVIISKTKMFHLYYWWFLLNLKAHKCFLVVNSII